MAEDKSVDAGAVPVEELAAFKHDPVVREAMAEDRPTTLATVEAANYAIANAELRQPAMNIEE